MSYKQIDEQFDEKFIETYGDGSSWGVGLRIKSDGTIKDRETLDEIKSFLHLIYDQAKAEVVNEIANDIGLTGADKVIFVDRYSGESNIKGLQSVLGGK